jgi:hypothetical protein
MRAPAWPTVAHVVNLGSVMGGGGGSGVDVMGNDGANGRSKVQVDVGLPEWMPKVAAAAAPNTKQKREKLASCTAQKAGTN